MAARYTVGHTLSMRGDALPKRQVMLADGTVRTESALTPRRVSGREGIGELFEYRVEALAPVSPMFYDKQALAQIELNRIAGTEVTLAIDLEGIEIAAPDMRAMPAFSGNGAGTREISGVVESAAVLGLEGSALLFELVIRPWCWLATLSTNSRNFNGPIIDILHDVLHV